MAMTHEQWKEIRVGDVLQNDSSGLTFVVVDTGGYRCDEVIVSRTMTTVNPAEWTRRRKTVDAD